VSASFWGAEARATAEVVDPVTGQIIAVVREP
jgi:dihydroxyacetone kinase-like predicted kinase